MPFRSVRPIQGEGYADRDSRAAEQLTRDFSSHVLTHWKDQEADEREADQHHHGHPGHERNSAIGRLPPRSRRATSGAPADITNAIVQMVVTIGPVQGIGSFQLSRIQPKTSSRNAAIRTSIIIPSATTAASSIVRE